MMMLSSYHANCPVGRAVVVLKNDEAAVCMCQISLTR